MRYFTTAGGADREFRFERRSGELWVVTESAQHRVDLEAFGGGELISLVVDGRSYDCLFERAGGKTFVHVRGERIAVQVEDERERMAHRVAGHRPAGPRQVEAAMPGVVVSVAVALGDAVEDGQTLAVLEAMKMQNPIQADGAGTVKRIAVRKGDAVAGGAVLFELE